MSIPIFIIIVALILVICAIVALISYDMDSDFLFPSSLIIAVATFVIAINLVLNLEMKR